MPATSFVAISGSCVPLRVAAAIGIETGTEADARFAHHQAVYGIGLQEVRKAILKELKLHGSEAGTRSPPLTLPDGLAGVESPPRPPSPRGGFAETERRLGRRKALGSGPSQRSPQS